MNRTVLWLACCIAVVPAHGAAQVSAEPWFHAGTLMLTLDVGGAAFTDFERSRARPMVATLQLGDFSRRVAAGTSGSVGGWVGYWIRNGWAIRAGTSYVPTRFRVWNEEAAQQALDDIAPDRVEPRYATLGIWMVDAALQFRFPTSVGRVVPYGLVGGGWIRYRSGDPQELPPEARTRFAGGEFQRRALLLGLGAAIPLQRGNLLMTFELTDHLARSPLQDRTAGETFDLEGIAMQIDPDPAVSGSDDVGLTNHVRLAFGLTLPLRY